MNHLLHQKQEPVFKNTKSLNKYPKIKSQSSDISETLQIYENSTVGFDDMLLLNQESNIGLFFTRGRHNNIDIYYIAQSFFHLPKVLFVLILKYLFHLNKLQEISYYDFLI